MLGAATRNILFGNVQLLEYCKNHSIDMSKLHQCNVERMGSKYFFVMRKKCDDVTLENDIDSQPDVVLTMDASSERFQFENTEWTKNVI